MTAWPNTLPAAPLAEHFHEDAPVTAIRSSMDQGPAKVRNRTTAGVRVMALGYLLSRTQVAVLDGFYASTLSGGALAFDFTHPRTGAVVSCRFRAAPAYVSTNGDYFHAGLELEVLP